MRKGVFAAKVSPLLIGLALTSLCYAQSAREIADRTLPSVGLVTLYDSNGTPLSLGSCFVVDEGIVATNLHVIEGGATATVTFGNQSRKLRVESVLAVDEQRDLALLKVSTSGLRPLIVADSSNVGTGDRIYAAGNPRGLTGTFSDGLVSAVRTIRKGLRLFQVSAPISPGSSGGPILNSSGGVIGVASAGIEGGQNLNFAVPSEYVLALMASERGEEKKISNFSKSKSTSFAGNSREKALIADRFKWTGTHANLGCTFVIKNTGEFTVKDVECIVIFLDEDERPIHFVRYTYKNSEIPPGLERTVELLPSGELVQQNFVDLPESVRKSTRSVQLRMLDYKIVR
ncbi:MAG: serine protease [Armatimonadetes bacterium]|nr:serine protease [Armatimonadota bacterium]